MYSIDESWQVYLYGRVVPVDNFHIYKNYSPLWGLSRVNRRKALFSLYNLTTFIGQYLSNKICMNMFIIYMYPLLWQYRYRSKLTYNVWIIKILTGNLQRTKRGKWALRRQREITLRNVKFVYWWWQFLF